MELGNIMKPAKTTNTGGARGFVFAAEISDESKAQLDAVRQKARSQGKVMSNVALAEAAIAELYRAYVEEDTEPETE